MTRSPQYWHVLERPDARLWFQDSGGHGPVVVLLHGLAGHAGEWRPLARGLGDGYRIIALDQRGHGHSTRRPADVSREAFVADAAALIREVSTTPVTLVGQSLGGHTAMLTAARHPDLVERLVMVEAGVGGDDPGDMEQVGAWLRSWPVPFRSLDHAKEFFGGDTIAAQAWAEGLEQCGDGLWPRFDIATMVDCLTPNHDAHWDDWAMLERPTLIIRGDGGFAPPAIQLDTMLGMLPAVRTELVADAGHDVHLDQPTACAKLMTT